MFNYLLFNYVTHFHLVSRFCCIHPYMQDWREYSCLSYNFTDVSSCYHLRETANVAIHIKKKKKERERDGTIFWILLKSSQLRAQYFNIFAYVSKGRVTGKVAVSRGELFYIRNNILSQPTCQWLFLRKYSSLA